MAIDRIVLLDGEEYYIIGDAIIEKPFSDNESIYVVCVALTKVEPASLKSIQRAMWMPLEGVIRKITNYDFTQSEWYQGVNNGGG